MLEKECNNNDYFSYRQPQVHLILQSLEEYLKPYPDLVSQINKFLPNRYKMEVNTILIHCMIPC